MSIGNWIVISFVLFATFIASLVVVCIRQDVNLVSPAYYQEELQFQKQMARTENAAQLKDRPTVEVTGKMLTLSLNQRDSVTDGTVNIFCPSNASMDRTFRMRAQGDDQVFDLADLRTGMYRVRLRWTMNGKEFFQEEQITL